MWNKHAARCTANAKITGKRCKNPAVRGRKTCRLHGGKSPRGKDHPSFKHGIYSEAMPDDMAAQFKAILGNPELISLRQEAALLSLQIEEELKADEIKWTKVNDLSAQRAKIVKEEAKIIRDKKLYISLQQHVTIVQGLVNAIRDIIPVDYHTPVQQAVRALYDRTERHPIVGRS